MLNKKNQITTQICEMWLLDYTNDQICVSYQNINFTSLKFKIRFINDKFECVLKKINFEFIYSCIVNIKILKNILIFTKIKIFHS